MSIDKRIEELESELEVLKKKAATKIEETTRGRIAIFLHHQLCDQTHTYGCGWHLNFVNGVHNWSEFSHQKYLALADELIKRSKNWKINSEQVESFIKDIIGPIRN